MKNILVIAAIGLGAMLSGCVGNKAEAEINALKIDRKPSAAEEAQGWAKAVNTLLGRESGSERLTE